MKIKEELGGKALMNESTYNEKLKSISVRMVQEAKQETESTMPKGKRSKGKTRHTYQRGPKRGKTEYVLSKKMQPSILLTAGDVSGVGLNIQRHGVFQEFGVSKGHPITGALRKQKKWITHVFDRNTPKIADVVGEYMADKVVRGITAKAR